MPPKFIESNFLFTNEEIKPEHEEVFPRMEDRDLSKWHLMGRDVFADENYGLVTDLDTEEDAVLLATARLRYLEATQPTIESGGQGIDGLKDGIQDRVYIFPPHPTQAIRFNPPQSELFGNSPEKP